MRLALAEAEKALTHDDVPVGAVILGPEGQLVGAGHNERELLQDPSAHAEMLAIREAAAAIGRRGFILLALAESLHSAGSPPNTRPPAKLSVHILSYVWRAMPRWIGTSG